MTFSEQRLKFEESLKSRMTNLDDEFLALMAEIETLQEFAEWMGILDQNLDRVSPIRQSYHADDLVGAFAAVLSWQARSPDIALSSMKSDIARLAWCYWISLSTE